MVDDVKAKERNPICVDVAFFRCGLCGADWEVEVQDWLKLIACPECQNASLQQLRGV